ncbi:hypothetical protein GOOTI_233_00050 [Gordonia otitidis NBRC 100426]|uniref:Uncharacterized protein n=1 Tax=Gordonia otitidis (strain DSM 44809 / CCUG 52243 / JCM 12355 / NBRC 100426 / IFM 10032) TaxID=1108044 RepID=H5TT79_GORO1|nr:hypothetical protein GOOTI_233_00050 [Gordonia otitidis NBRC 100426]
MPPPGAADAAVGGSGGSGDSERNVVEYARDKQCLCVRFEPGELDECHRPGPAENDCRSDRGTGTCQIG